MAMNTELSDDLVTDNGFVTIIMPIRNEAVFIDRSLSAILNQDYPPDQLEVLVVDGVSDDGTREAIRKIIADWGRCIGVPMNTEQSLPCSSDLNPNCGPKVIIIDNPFHFVPHALNMALRLARGQVIIRVDGHCQIHPDYVRRCVEALERTGADCVGGPMVTVGETWVAKAIAVAQSSFFGVGGVAFRTERRQGTYVDTVAFGAYRREVFDRIGVFDEELVRNQDDEFNFRLIQAGGKIWLDPSIRSVYYSRGSLRGLWQQYFQYGLYKVRLIQKRGAVPSLRHLVPGGFVLAFAFSIILAIITSQFFWSLSVIGPYWLANMTASFWAGRKDWATLPLLPVTFVILHGSYGLGFLWGFWRWRKKGFRGQTPAGGSAE